MDCYCTAACPHAGRQVGARDSDPDLLLPSSLLGPGLALLDAPELGSAAGGLSSGGGGGAQGPARPLVPRDAQDTDQEPAWKYSPLRGRLVPRAGGHTHPSHVSLLKSQGGKIYTSHAPGTAATWLHPSTARAMKNG